MSSNWRVLRHNGLSLRTLIDPGHTVNWLYPPSSHWDEGAYPRRLGEGMRYAPLTIVVPENGRSATAWSGGLSVEGLEQAVDISAK